MEMLHIFYLLAVSSTAKASGWEYGNEGHWEGVCQTGLQQSPINVISNEVVVHTIHPFQFNNYNISRLLTATNNGHTVNVNGFDKWSQVPYITGGGLKAKYILQQFHFHWGSANNYGSEHSFDGLYYPLELHLVHMREGMTMETAVNHPEGLAVIGIIFDVNLNGEALMNLTAAIPSYSTVGNQGDLQYYLDALLPDERDVFYRYPGSLTTPPCSEAVIWTVLAKPNYVTEEQLSWLRLHFDEHDQLLTDNWRGIQPLNKRKVHKSKTGKEKNIPNKPANKKN